MLTLEPASSALVLIDLQKGILSRSLEPRSGAEVLARGVDLARRFRAAGALVVLARVDFASDYADALRQPVDEAMARPQGGLPPEWSELADGLAQPRDLRIIKRQWGAFHGTELDLQLRRRGVTTIVLGGIATNFGVESTARQAWEHGYAVVLAEDACASVAADLHAFAIRSVFPRIARVRPSADIGLAAS